MALVAAMPEDSLVRGLLERIATEGEKPKPRVSKLRQQLLGAAGGDAGRLRGVSSG